MTESAASSPKRPPQRRRLAGHVRTVLPAVRHRIVPKLSPEWRPWRHSYHDPASGRVDLSGALSQRDTDSGDAGYLLILVHGLGGSIESHYMLTACRAAVDLGLSCLRLNLRGADRQPVDIYHAGLTTDVAAALDSPHLARYERIDVMGFSLGGHVTLKFAIEVEDERVGAVAAVCSPLDLAATVRDFDGLPRFPYREYIVGAAKRNVLRILDGRDLPGGIDPRRVRRVTTLREFDAATVVPRFDFDDPDHYYRSQSVVHRLREFRRPALLVAAEGDPMISARSIRAGLRGGSGSLQVAWSERGGHVGFPPGVDLCKPLGLGPGAPLGLEAQVISWLLLQS